MKKTYVLWEKNGVQLLIDPSDVAEMVCTDGMIMIEGEVNRTELEPGLGIGEIEELFPGASVSWADDYTPPDEKGWFYSPEDGLLWKASQLERSKVYMWWDGRNHRREVLDPHDVETAVVVTEKSVCLDEWDGKNWVTGSMGHHEYVHLVLEVDGKPKEDLFLLVHRSQWQGDRPTGELMGLDELRRHLQELGRDEGKYMYEVGKLHENIVPELVGSKEFYDLLGWTKERFNALYRRQSEGKNVRTPLPEPVQTLAVTAVWTREQAEEYARMVKKEKEV